MFNVRVYGILINEKKQVLVSGGLEFGEGTRDCLKREFLEEMNLNIEVTRHLYTTDFFQKSAFHPQQQIISIYYLVNALEPISVPLRSQAFDFDEQQLKVYAAMQMTETFRFIDWEKFSPESVTLPIDKVVARLIKENI